MADNEMTLNKLRETHEYYAMFLSEWNYTQAAYDGTRALIRINAIVRHERESLKNYQKRIAQLYGFCYSKSIVDLLNHYLFRKPVKITLPDSLTSNKQWEQFAKDCDLMENPLSDFFLEQSRYASIQGHVGLLVDKASAETTTVADEIKGGIYPYISAYRPSAILDWEWERDASNRPFLSYLKLQDEDGFYRIWTPEKWEIWKETGGALESPVPVVRRNTPDQPVTASVQAASLANSSIEKVSEGKNVLGEIPFVWLYNTPGSYRGIGTSDIADISYIDVSIIRNLSQGEEIIDYAAFPMMRKPMQEAGADDQQDDTGVTVVLEFNPEQPDSKPDWLESAVAEPIDAIVGWIAQKISEIYRSANFGGITATENDTEAKSGVALKAEFQMLNSRLASKARYLQKAHKRVLYYWLKWQKMDGVLEEVQIEYPNDFDIENLAEDLANILTSRSIVVSDLFRKHLQKMVARRMLPTLSEEEMAEIDKDIDASPTTDEMLMFDKETEREFGAKEEEEEEPDEPGASKGKPFPGKEKEFPRKLKQRVKD